MDSANSKKRGRPATGRVRDAVLFMRVPAGIKEELKVRLRGVLTSSDVDRLCKSAAGVQNAPTGQETASNANVMALLEDVDRLEKEKALLEEKIQKVARMSESELVQAWVHKYDKLVASMKKGEFDQE